MGIILVLVFGSPFQRKTFSRIGVGIKTFVSRTTFCIVFKFVLAMKKLNKLPLGVKQQWINQSINRMPCLITNVNLSFCPLSFVYYVLCPLTLDFLSLLWYLQMFPIYSSVFCFWYTKDVFFIFSMVGRKVFCTF